MTDVTIGNSVTSLPGSVFGYCPLLTNVTIGNSVTTIGEGAFSSCSSLTNITIPDSVTTIEEYAFENCSSLNEITCLATTAPNISYTTFKDISTDGTLYVPSKSNYRSWMIIGTFYLGYYNWTTQEI